MGGQGITPISCDIQPGIFWKKKMCIRVCVCAGTCSVAGWAVMKKGLVHLRRKRTTASTQQ